MDMNEFLAMVDAIDLTPFAGAYFEVDGEVTGTFD